MKGIKEKAIILTLLFAILLAMAPAVFANSAEPPSIIILVNNPPEDMVLQLAREDGIVESRKTEKMLESKFSFYSYHFRADYSYRLLVTADGERFVLPLDVPKGGYNNLYRLDLKSRTLKAGRDPVRNAVYVALRIILTLVIEGLVFYAFGFRKKKSWILFLVINLMTQGALNIWLNSMFPSNGYIIFALVIGEFFVFLAEGIGFLLFLDEFKRLKTAIYVILANLASLIAGGYLITLLPL